MNKTCGLLFPALCSLVFTMQLLALEVLPEPQRSFTGQVGRTLETSVPEFPEATTAPADAPNILLIMTDDVGFAASSTFGGLVPTPTLDQLANTGVRYNQFHTTALCSPTRAALITGRNHHSAATGAIMEFATGYPGYNSIMPKSTGTIAEVLKQHGYNTSWFGKNHNVPDWQSSQAGPFDLWPTSLGFEYFFGFIGGDTDQWHSALFEGTVPVESHEQRGPNPAHLDKLLADKAIAWIRQQHAMAPEKPFFAYVAPGTSHAPHHAPKAWIEKFKGQFDQGWDSVRAEIFARQKAQGIIPATATLSARPASIPAWDDLSAEQKKLYARMMEVYAAALSHVDYQISRIIDAVAATGELDNTLVVFIQGDNGASGEGSLQGLSNEVAAGINGVEESTEYLLSIIDELGGPNTYNHYPAGWAHAMDTPFQWTKQVASHFGGTRNGLVLSWPERTEVVAGEIRAQFHHVIDIVPTLLEATGIRFPDVLNGVEQKPIEGVSMLYTLSQPDAPSARQSQYFEMLGNRGIYHEGWMASTTPLRLPWGKPEEEPNPDDFVWELYNVAEDFSQSNNIAAKHPEKLEKLRRLFDREAKKYQVYPLQTSVSARFDPSGRPSLTRGRSTFTYLPGMKRIPEGAAPDVKNRSYSLSAEVVIPRGGADGVLATQGGRFGGWGLLIVDGKPLFVHAISNQQQHKYRVASSQQLSAGKHVIRFDFDYDGGGRGKGGIGTLSVDGKPVARQRIERTVRYRFSLDETFDVGEDTGTPVIEDYVNQMPFSFTGALETFTIELR